MAPVAITFDIADSLPGQAGIENWKLKTENFNFSFYHLHFSMS
jgi:hypothetical protein